MASRLLHICRAPRVGWLLRLAFAVVILTLLFTRINFASLLNVLCLLDLRLLVPVLGLYFAFRCVLAYQMSLGLIPSQMSLTVLQLLRINLISGFYSLVLPGGMLAGSIAVWYKLYRPYGKAIEVGVLVIYFRLMNVFTLLAIGLIGLWFDPPLISPGFRVAIGTMFVGNVLVVLPFISATTARLMERLGTPLLNRLPLPCWLKVKGREIWTALTAFHALKKGSIALMLGMSLLSNMIGILIWFLLALAVNIHPSIFVIGWIHSLVATVQMIPVSIAGLGLREVSLVVLLRGHGISEAQALSFSLTIFGLIVVGGLVGGLLEIWGLLQGGRRAGGVASGQKVETNTEIST